ncbi:MAG: KdsC family phosphatase [Elusimicrobiales bacterium]
MNKKLKRIKIFLMDVDGVLTDGKMFYFTDSSAKMHELNAFNSQDGVGLIVLNKFGIHTGIVTGRESDGVYERARLLKMSFVYQGFLTKILAVEEILKRTKLSWDELCYMGDDLPDIPVLKKCGFAASPSNAIDDVKKVCDYVSKKKGGDGAVREVCDMIIKAKGFVREMKMGFEKGIWPNKNLNVKTINILYSQWRKVK